MKARWMMRHARQRKRLLAIWLCAMLLVTSVPIPVFAAGESCAHHTEHTANCGYATAAPCAHAHTDACYTTVTNCVHQHGEECLLDESGAPTACTHVCSVESGCVVATLNCQHTHDGSCGYSEAHACEFVCETCAAEAAAREQENQKTPEPEPTKTDEPTAPPTGEPEPTESTEPEPTESGEPETPPTDEPTAPPTAEPDAVDALIAAMDELPPLDTSGVDMQDAAAFAAWRVSAAQTYAGVPELHEQLAAYEQDADATARIGTERARKLNDIYDAVFAPIEEPQPDEEPSVAAGTILGFAALAQTEYTVPFGTAQDALSLPATLVATAADGNGGTAQITVENVVWSGWDSAAGTHALTASAEGHTLAEGVQWPGVTVTVQPEPDAVDALIAAIDALPTFDYSGVDMDDEAAFAAWLTAAKQTYASAPALYQQLMTYAEDAEAMARIGETRAQKLSEIYMLLFGTAMLTTDISGNVTESATWNGNDGDNISGSVTISGGTEEEPIVITVEGTVMMNAGISIASGYIKLTGGGTLKRDGYTGAMITMTGGTLTIAGLTLDGGAVWTGTENATLGRGTTNSGEIATGSIIKASGGQIYLNSGAALQNNANSTNGEDGGAISLKDNSEYTFNGNAQLTINGARIINNYSGQSGGAIKAVDRSTITMNSGEISGNQSARHGGAMQIFSNVSAATPRVIFNMSGGTINNNMCSAFDHGVGGGIAVSNYSTFNMSGGEIKGNVNKEASRKGGGVAFADANTTMTVSGNAVITGNKLGSVDNNVHIGTNTNNIITSDALTEGASIGVTTDRKPSGSGSVAITGENGENDYSSFFFSDSDSYDAFDDASDPKEHVVKLRNVFTVTFDANSGILGSVEQVKAIYNVVLPTIVGAGTLPSRAGYAFAGFFDEASGGNKYYNGDGTCAKSWDKTSDAELFAQWSPISYSVSYGSGQHGSITGSETANVETAYTDTLVPDTGYSRPNDITMTLDGGSFTEFDYDSSTGAISIAAGKITGNIVISGACTPNSYTLTLDANGGTLGTLAQVSATYGAAMPEISGVGTLPARAGYTFAGFFDAASGGTKYYNADGSSAKSWDKADTAMLYAHWSPKDYNVAYAAGQHGSITGSTTANITTAYAATLTPDEGYSRPSAITMTMGGASFSEFGYTSSSGAITIAAGKVTGDIVISGACIPGSYTVQYHGNGATGGSTATSSHTYGVAKALTANGFTRAYTVTYNHNYAGSTNGSSTANYAFAGWNTNSAGTGASYTNKQSVMNLATGGTFNLYAKWTSGSVTLPTPTRTGYAFSGWYRDVACTDTHRIGAGGAGYTPTAQITLYAKWTAYEYSITLDRESGTTGATRCTATYGENTVAGFTAPTRLGYSFNGYWTGAGGTGSMVITTTGRLVSNVSGYTGRNGIWQRSSATTLHAKWVTGRYKVTYSAGQHGSLAGSTTARYDSSYIGTLIPSTGYSRPSAVTLTMGGNAFNDFAYTRSTGDISIAKNKVVGDIVVTGSCNPNRYTVYYYGNGATGGDTAASSHTYDVAKSLTRNGFTRVYTLTLNSNYTGAANSSIFANYTFGGWNTDEDGAGRGYANGATVTNLATFGVVDLFAQWVGGSLTLPTPTRAGYTFEGWYSDPSCADAYRVGSGGARYSPVANATFYAKWTQSTYAITLYPTSKAFDERTSGYASAPAAQTVTITNAGNRTITGYRIISGAGFSVAYTSEAIAPGGTSTFTVRPSTGLSVGSHAAAITVITTEGSTKAMNCSFAVYGAPSVTISGDTSIAQGESTRLTANASGGKAPYSYRWSTNETVRTAVVSPRSATSYTVTVEDSLGGRATATVRVSVASPTATPKKTATPKPGTNTATPKPGTNTATPKSPTNTPTPKPATNTATPKSPTHTATPKSPTNTPTPKPATNTATPKSPTHTATPKSPTNTATPKSPTGTGTPTGTGATTSPVVTKVTATPTSPLATPTGATGSAEPTVSAVGGETGAPDNTESADSTENAEPTPLDATDEATAWNDAPQGDEQTQAYKYGNGRILVSIPAHDGVVLAKLPDETAVIDATLDTEEMESVEAGATVEIRLDVKRIPDEALTQDKQIIESALEKFEQEAPGLKLGGCLDISLSKRVGDDAWQAIPDAGKPITVVIDIPDEMLTTGAEYYILRSHEGGYTLLEDQDDDPRTITILTQYFSTYAIAYQATEGAAGCVWHWITLALAVLSALASLLWKDDDRRKRLLLIALAALLMLSTAGVGLIGEKCVVGMLIAAAGVVGCLILNGKYVFWRKG